MRIKPGTTIRWQTPASRRIDSCSFSNKREGIYMGLLPPGAKAETVCPVLADVPSSAKKFGYPGGTSVNSRVIVRVPRFHATTGKPIVPHWYGPRVSAVTHAYLEGEWVEVDPKQVEWL